MHRLSAIVEILTRWNTWLLMARRMVRLKEAIREALRKWTDDTKDDTTDDQYQKHDITMKEWADLKAVVEVMSKFEFMTAEVSTSKEPSMSHAREFLETIKLHMLQDHSADCSTLKIMRSSWREAFDKKFKQYFTDR